jgi:hypothetical protein
LNDLETSLDYRFTRQLVPLLFISYFQFESLYSASSRA